MTDINQPSFFQENKTLIIGAAGTIVIIIIVIIIVLLLPSLSEDKTDNTNTTISTLSETNSEQTPTITEYIKTKNLYVDPLQLYKDTYPNSKYIKHDEVELTYKQVLEFLSSEDIAKTYTAVFHPRFKTNTDKFDKNYIVKYGNIIESNAEKYFSVFKISDGSSWGWNWNLVINDTDPGAELEPVSNYLRQIKKV